MQNIIIDEEIRDLLPALDGETLKSLEESILQYGCMYPLVITTLDGVENVLIDGHNRYAICTEHGIDFETSYKEFQTREDALIWVISNQVARRNLTPVQLSYFRGLHYNKEKKLVGNSTGANGREEEFFKNERIPQTTETAALLAKKYDISKSTIYGDAKAAASIDKIGNASPKAKSMIFSGEAKIDKKVLKELSSASEDEIKSVAADILNGVYEKKDTVKESQPPTPLDLALFGIAPINTAIGKAADALERHLPNIKEKAGRARLRTTLKQYTDMLGELYIQV
ncbi:MAG: hypothetical protein FWH17_00775 [Oscillospiraceae bacterium]|nr:hypothetical protein [Oscillospiraceae bacterium]